MYYLGFIKSKAGQVIKIIEADNPQEALTLLAEHADREFVDKRELSILTPITKNGGGVELSENQIEQCT